MSFCFSKAQQVSLVHIIKYSDFNFSKAIASDNSGNIFLAGYYRNNAGQRGVFLHKFSGFDGLIWKDTVAVASGSSAAVGLAVDEEGNAFFSRTGQINFGNEIHEGHHLIKYNSQKQIQWLVNSPPCFNVVIDQTGALNVASNKIYKYSNLGIATSTINITKSGNISIDQSGNYYVVTVDSINKRSREGNLLWAHASMVDSKIALDKSGNCYISETGFEFVSPFTKLDPAGNVLWSMNLPFFGANALVCDEDDNVFIVGVYGVGQAIDGIEIRKISSAGTTLWTYQLPNSGAYRPGGIIKIDNALYMSADRAFYYDACLFKIDLPSNILSSEKNVQNSDGFQLSVSPNPSRCFTVSCNNKINSKSLTLIVSDINGKCIYNKTIQNSGSELNEKVDLGEFPKGIYSLEIRGENHTEIKKLIIE